MNKKSSRGRPRRQRQIREVRLATGGAPATPTSKTTTIKLQGEFVQICAGSGKPITFHASDFYAAVLFLGQLEVVEP